MRHAPPFYVGLAVPAVFAVVWGIGALKLGFRVDGIPGPGVLPFACAILLAVITACVGFSKPQPDDEAQFAGTAVAAVISVLCFAALAPYGGLVVSTFALIAVWVRYFHRESWVRAVAAASVLVAANVVLFGYLLKVRLPLGPVYP